VLFRSQRRSANTRAANLFLLFSAKRLAVISL